MTLARRKPPKMGLRHSERIRSPSHLKWVRGFDCIVKDKLGTHCDGRIEAAHVRSSKAGGTGLKPGDDWAVPLCSWHHHIQHNYGEAEFENRYGLDLKAIAKELAKRSPHLRVALQNTKHKL